MFIIALTAKERIYDYLNKIPQKEIELMDNNRLYVAFPDVNKATVRRHKANYLTKPPDHVITTVHDQKHEVPQTPQTPSHTDLTSPPPPPTGQDVGFPFTNRSGNIPTGSYNLNPFIQEILNIQKEFVYAGVNCNVKDAIELRNQAQILAKTKDLPPWSRSKCLSPKQHQIIDAITDPSIRVVFVDGDKRTGKSTAGWVGICENIWNGKIIHWGFWAATQKLGEKIHRDVKYDPITINECQQLYKGLGSAQRTLFFNDGYVEVGATENEDSFSGQAYQGVWIDECHSIIKTNPKTFAMIAMILRSVPNLKMVLTANQGGLQFQELKNDLINVVSPEEIAFFVLSKDDTTHITDEADELVRVLVKASAGEEMAAQFLDNAVVREGNLYYPSQKIYQAYQEFDPPKLEQYDIIACGIDWGDNHDSAFVVMGFVGDEAYEEEIVYLQHPSNTEIERVVVRLIREYPGIIFIWETSPLGSFVRKTIRETYPNVRFLDSSYTKHKQAYIDNIYIWLVDEDIHLKDGKLKRQLLSYINDKKNDDGHDALAHVMYKAVAARTQMKIEMHAINRERD